MTTFAGKFNDEYAWKMFFYIFIEKVLTMVLKFYYYVNSFFEN